PTLLPTTLLVSLHVCGALRALHSFPTRRSSDLHVENFRLRDGVFSLIFTPATAPVESPANKSIKELSAASTLFGTPMLSRQKSADRKSTRLNSSHVSISYAVFCLKKKRNKLSAC